MGSADTQFSGNSYAASVAYTPPPSATPPAGFTIPSVTPTPAPTPMPGPPPAHPTIIDFVTMIKGISTPYGVNINGLDKPQTRMIDSQVLAQLAYLPFGTEIPNFELPLGAWKQEDFSGKTVGELAEYYLNTDAGKKILIANFSGGIDPDLKQIIPVNSENDADEYKYFLKFLQAVKGSHRYSNLYILDTYCRSETFPDMPSPLDGTQSAAYVFSTCDPKKYALDDVKDIFIAYRGTDGTFNGWKEDGVMGFKVPDATRDQRDFTEAIFNNYPNATVNMTAHSKGCYSEVLIAAWMDKEFPERIQNVFALDGPAYSKNVLKQYKSDLEKIMGKTYFVYPENSVVGQIGFLPSIPKGHAFYVKSEDDSVIMQHSLLNWRYSYTDLGPYYGGIKYNGNVMGSQSAFTKQVDALLNAIQSQYPENKMPDLISAVFSLIGKNNENSMWTWDLNNPNDLQAFKDNLLEGLSELSDDQIDAVALFIRIILNTEVTDTSQKPLSLSDKIGIFFKAFTGEEFSLKGTLIFDAIGVIFANVNQASFGFWGSAVSGTVDGVIKTLLKAVRDDIKDGLGSSYFARLLYDELTEDSILLTIVAIVNKWGSSNKTRLGIVENIAIWALKKFKLSSLKSLKEEYPELYKRWNEGTLTKDELDIIVKYFAVRDSFSISYKKIYDSLSNRITELATPQPLPSRIGTAEFGDPEWYAAYSAELENNRLKKNNFVPILADLREYETEIFISLFAKCGTVEEFNEAYNRFIKFLEKKCQSLWDDFDGNNRDKLWRGFCLSCEEFISGLDDKKPQSGVISSTDLELQIKSNNFSVASVSAINLGTALFIGSSGGVSSVTASSTGGRIFVNIKNLRNLKALAENLLNEVSSAKHTDVITQARLEANRALSKYSQSYVRSDANAVLKLCAELETARSRTCADLRTEIYGLEKVIGKYLDLERCFA